MNLILCLLNLLHSKTKYHFINYEVLRQIKIDSDSSKTRRNLTIAAISAKKGVGKFLKLLTAIHFI